MKGVYSEYKEYIEHIYSNLFQCGVPIPPELISPIESYEELFKRSFVVDDILFLYKIFAVVDYEESLDSKGDFFLPLGEHYLSIVRKLAHEEFNSDLENYKKLLGQDILLGNEGLVVEDEDIQHPEEEEPKIWVAEDSEDTSEITDDETKDFFEDLFVDVDNNREEEDPLKKVYYPSTIPKQDFSIAPPNLDLLEQREYVGSGVFLEDMVTEEKEYTSNGVFLEDYKPVEVEKEDESILYDENGFEISDEDNWVDDEEDVVEEAEDSSNRIRYDENGFEIVEDDGWSYDEEDVVEEAEDSSNSVRYDENGFEISEDDDGWNYNDEEEVETPQHQEEVRYDENGFEIVEDNGWGSSEDEDDFEEQEYVKPVSSSTENISRVINTTEQEKDIVDLLIAQTNTIVNKGIRAGRKFIKGS